MNPWRTHRERLVIVGSGMVGVRLIERLVELAAGRWDITVIGDEPRPGYDRIKLSAVLAGDAGWDDLTLRGDAWYRDHAVNLRLGARVIGIDRARRTVTTGDGEETPYDQLVLATGSRPLIPPIAGADRPGVVAFRTAADCAWMIDAAAPGRPAAVIGGGLLGLEAARGLQRRGMAVTVVHLVDRPMERQLDVGGGAVLARAVRDQGIDLRVDTATEAIVGGDRVEAVRFRDGQELATDLVVMAAGTRPNLELGRAAGLDCGRGIRVDDHMATSDARIAAVGECAEHRGTCYGLVAPLYQQVEVLAARLAGREVAGYAGSVVATRLKVSGIDLFSGGEPQEQAGDQVLRVEDSGRGLYRKAIVRDGRLVGAILIGEPGPAAAVDALLRSGRALQDADRGLLTGASAPAAAAEPLAAARELPAEAIVCGCNGVAKAAIVAAIAAGRLTTRKEVAACTNASRSCGGCGPQVDALLAACTGAAPVKRAALCDCTDLDRAAVIAAIRAHRFTRVAETMQALGWRGEGCAVCRPAINYYLTLCWPGENQDDPRSRLVNERVHANIQADGTYSVVPRIYGGVTTPEELIRIGEVARKYRVPTVKITGGQRIDLLGVRKEELPAIWDELDLPSGFAYAKAVRTVKTCVGSTWCRFGTRDSMGLGARIERELENLWTPAKVKMAVNGCPRNCAESLIKDVGLIGVDQGWEIYVGGNGGVDVAVAQKLCTEPDDAAAIASIKAFLQLYREEAAYGQRTAHWLPGFGLAAARARVCDDAGSRTALIERIDAALARRVDPWRERAARFHGGDAATIREYTAVEVEVRG